MKQKDWTDQLRDRLSDYEAAVPEGLWADIEQSLPQAKTQPLWRRWASIAAAVALLAGAGWWLWPETETPVNGRQAAQSEQTAQPDAKPQRLLAQTAQPALAPVAPTPPKDDLAETTGETKTEDQPQTEEQPRAEEQTQAEEQPKAEEQPRPMPHDPTATAAHPVRKPAMTTTGPQKTARSLSLGLYANGSLLALNRNQDTQPNHYYANDAVLPAEISTNNPDTIMTLPGIHHDEQRQHHDHPVSFGLSVTYPLSDHWSLQSGLVYTRLHSEFVHVTLLSQTTREQTLHYLGIPLNLHYQLLKGRQWRLYASAGSQVDWNISARQQTQGVSHETERDHLQWSVGGALGAEYNPIPLLGIYAEPGLRHYFDNGSSVQNYFKDQPTSWTLHLGIRLNLSSH